MKNIRKSASDSVYLLVIALLVLYLFALSAPADAQQAGNNAVFNSTGNCTSMSLCAASTAFIDASVLTQPGFDFCKVLNTILSGTSITYPSTGAVIDARGLNSSNVSSMKCAASPWAGISNPPPSTILLPATSPTAPIVITTTWYLPMNTHVIGQGDNISSGTTIQACVTNGCFTGPAMIEFGSSACTSACGTAVENVLLNGNGQAINGIVNSLFQDLSYVDHVSIYQLVGIGLLVSGSANYSGPYTNITFNTGNASAQQSTACVQIKGVSTRGIHGLTCISNGMPNAGVLLDGSNNTIEDASIDGVGDGIVVGENANAQSDVLLNILNPGNVGIYNLVHICGSNSSYGTPCITTNYTLTDLAIMNSATPPFSCQNPPCRYPYSTIKDDATGTGLLATSDDHVGMYVLGKSANGGYSRFTTSPRVATWAVGSGGPGSGSCAPGSLYSNTNGSAPALYACVVSTSTWQSIK